MIRERFHFTDSLLVAKPKTRTQKKPIKIPEKQVSDASLLQKSIEFGNLLAHFVQFA